MDKCIIACICKNEGKYIKEFIDYHFSIGFDQIIIGDNNDSDGEDYKDLLSQYDNNKMRILNLRGLEAQQIPFYNYVVNSIDYDWCAFIDCDEFITFSEKCGIKDIHDFLSQNSIAKIYGLNWMCYGDNGLIEYDGRSCEERFKVPMPFDFCFNYRFPENFHIKSIVNKKAKCHFENPHFVIGDSETYSPSMKYKIIGPFNQNIDYDIAYIRHFYTKSLEEWVNHKIPNGNVTLKKINDKTPHTIAEYFKYNKVTPEKLEYLKKQNLTY